MLFFDFGDRGIPRLSSGNGLIAFKLVIEMAHNFVHTDSILTILAPIQSSKQGLLNQARIDEIGPV